ncbi:hypothetical protein [Parapedobacter sp. 2B3]|uniref:hypothetical protein n=1 Tax=Parapedobacter sp. 2B3 TaxID=3342381 RepID=UPI0035B65A0D
MISQSTYKDKDSIVLENGVIRAEFLPHPGGKMVSFQSKESGFEFLVQRPGEIYKDQPFDGDYVAGECSGFDDMFPTIDVCEYQEEPWKGAKMADHGEVWSLPWESELTTDAVELKVEGVRFPYELTKRIYFLDERTLRFDYSLKNRSAFDFEFLWAGHFMFNMDVGTEVVVPNDCKRAVSVFTNANRPYGEILNWPLFENAQGDTYAANISRPATVKAFEKYYFENKLESGWCELVYKDLPHRLRLDFTAETVPYLGILMNEGGWGGLYNIFIEPCTVCYDRPDVAKQRGQVSKVPPHSTYLWGLNLQIKR